MLSLSALTPRALEAHVALVLPHLHDGELVRALPPNRASRQMQHMAEKVMQKLEPRALALQIEPLVRICARADVAEVRKSVLRLLDKIDAALLLQHMPTLLPLLSDSEHGVQRYALELLARLPPEALAHQSGALLPLLAHPHRDVRRAALGALEGLEPRALDDRAAAALLQQVQHPTFEVRRDALRLLGSLDTRRLDVGALLPLLRDENWEARWFALELLSRFGPQALAPHLDAFLLLLADDRLEGEAGFLPHSRAGRGETRKDRERRLVRDAAIRVIESCTATGS